MRRLILTLVLTLCLTGFISSQIGLTVSNDTVICIGTQTLLECEIDTVLYETSSYNVYIMPFTPVLPYTGTSIADPFPLIDDRYYGPKQIGFTFCFFGVVYDQFWAGANGWISFQPLAGATYDPWVTQPIPNADSTRPRAAIMFPYRDWHPGVSGSILYDLVGIAPNRKLIVSYVDVALNSCTSSHGNFQCVLHETTNIIDINLLNCPTCPTWNQGNGVMGIQNAPGTQAFIVPGRNNTNWTAQNETWRFAPNGPAQPQDIIWTDNWGTNYGVTQSLVVNPTQTTTYTATYSPCGVVFEADVVVTPQPCGILSGMGSNINCFGASTGIATVTITDGIPPFDYEWSNGTSSIGITSSVNTISNLSAGIYTVTVSSLNGYYHLVDSFLVTHNPQIFVDSESLPESYPGASDGIITVDVTNGIPPFVYSCTGQPNSLPTLNSNYSFEGLTNGNYQITVSDVFGCMEIDSAYVQTNIDIEELDKSGFYFYPNPANDILNISLNGINVDKLYLYNSNGKLIKIVAMQGSELSLDLKGLIEGVYFIQSILDDGRIISKSFINTTR